MTPVTGLMLKPPCAIPPYVTYALVPTGKHTINTKVHAQ